MIYTEKEIEGEPFAQRFREIRTSYSDTFEEKILKEMGEVILGNDDYTGPEYRFLCWLISKKIIDNPGINLPHIPMDIEKIEIEEFKDQYVDSDERENLFGKLLSFIEFLKKSKKIDVKISILIGGSFTDRENKKPNDIDGIILIPEDKWNQAPHEFFESFIRLSHPSFDTVSFDFKTLPSNYDVDNFKGYNDISLLANNTKYRDDGSRILNNHFMPRTIVQISI